MEQVVARVRVAVERALDFFAAGGEQYARNVRAYYERLLERPAYTRWVATPLS